MKAAPSSNYLPSSSAPADPITVGYTGVFNVLDYSCVSFPTGIFGKKDLDTPLNDYEPLSAVCKETHAECKLTRTQHISFKH